jgi:hypothetical protein
VHASGRSVWPEQPVLAYLPAARRTLALCQWAKGLVTRDGRDNRGEMPFTATQPGFLPVACTNSGPRDCPRGLGIFFDLDADCLVAGILSRRGLLNKQVDVATSLAGAGINAAIAVTR